LSGRGKERGGAKKKNKLCYTGNVIRLGTGENERKKMEGGEVLDYAGDSLRGVGLKRGEERQKEA